MRLTELCCDCTPSVAAERIRRRMAAGGDRSEATPEIGAQLVAEADRWPEAVTIDTTGPLGDAVGLAEAVATRR